MNRLPLANFLTGIFIVLFFLFFIRSNYIDVDALPVFIFVMKLKLCRISAQSALAASSSDQMLVLLPFRYTYIHILCNQCYWLKFFHESETIETVLVRTIRPWRLSAGQGARQAKKEPGEKTSISSFTSLCVLFHISLFPLGMPHYNNYGNSKSTNTP